MLTCPVCKKPLADPAPQCPRCRADLSVLADIMKDVRTLLDKAAAQARDGQLGAAVRAYLDVLDVDPANAAARAALGDVITAVRGVERARRRVRPEHVLIALLAVAGLGGRLVEQGADVLHDVGQYGQVGLAARALRRRVGELFLAHGAGEHRPPFRDASQKRHNKCA